MTFLFGSQNPSAIKHKMEEIVRVKARREAIVKAGMSEVLSNYRRCDKSDLMGC